MKEEARRTPSTLPISSLIKENHRAAQQSLQRLRCHLQKIGV